MEITAVVVPRVTCDLPLQPVSHNLSWTHLSDLTLADSDFGRPGRVDLLLGVEVFAHVLMRGRRLGPPGSPVALETTFGWVLAGDTTSSVAAHHVVAHHVSILSENDILYKFWELEEHSTDNPTLSIEERYIVKHFEDNFSQTSTGRFIVPLPRKLDVKPLGESRSRAVRRFLSLERSLHKNGQFKEFEDVMSEYLNLGYAELVPLSDLQKPPEEIYYLPVHLVRKESSTTTKVRAVFDTSKSSLLMTS